MKFGSAQDQRSDRFCEDRDQPHQDDDDAADQRDLVPAEAAPDGVARRRDRLRSQRRRRTGSSGERSCRRLHPSVLHARVEPRVADVGEQVEEDDQERDQHHVAHQQREVELAQRVDEQPAHPGPGEDRLGDDRAGDQTGQRERDDGDQRDQRVLQTVLEDDRGARDALRRGGAHVVGADHFEHRAAHEPAALRDEQQREHDRRQDQMLQAVAPGSKVSRSRDAGRRQLRSCSRSAVMPYDRERELHHQREPEHRHRLAEEREAS